MCGSGSYSIVYKCFNQDNGEILAIKAFNIGRDNSGEEEEGFYKRLNYIDYFSEYFLPFKDQFIYHGHFCIVSECYGISLYQALQIRQFKLFPIDAIKFIILKIAKALSLMHLNGMIHTDVKLENILLPPGFDCIHGFNQIDCPISEPSSPLLSSSNITVSFSQINSSQYSQTLVPLDVRLIDFSSIVSIYNKNTHLATTRAYRAPEIMMGIQWDEKCDSWSLGCLLLELLVGSICFDAEDDLSHLFLIQHIIGPFPDWMINATTKKGIHDAFFCGLISPSFLPDGQKDCYLKKPALREILNFDSSLLELTLKLLDPDPKTRLSVSDAIDHPALEAF